MGGFHLNWKSKKVLVTGASGFIGSHLVERLVEMGAMTRALVQYNELGTWGWLDDIPISGEIDVVAADICDHDSIRQAVKGMDIVFHLAALIAIPYSYKAPVSYVRTNVEGTLNVLQASHEFGINRLIHTSTSEVYGTARYVPIDENHPLQGQSPYAASKIAADKLAEAFYMSFDLPVVTIRPFNTFGPRQSARAVIPTIITQIIKNDSVCLGKLSPTRDFNYVANTVDGFLLAASTPGIEGQTINLGTAREISISDLSELIAQLLNKSIQIEQKEERMRPVRSEVERLMADITMATELLGWYPKVNLEQGLKYTIEWVQNHLERYRPGFYAI
jgi:dTDP-glucose 4,6-dehydratase